MLEEERRAARARDARQRLAVERLRRQVVELQARRLLQHVLKNSLGFQSVR